MDFSQSEDQSLLSDSIDRFLEKEYDFAARTKTVDEKGGYSPDVWRSFAELGWTGACLPEDMGGYGGSPVEAMIIMERFGRHLVVEPFVWTVIVGGQLLQAVNNERRTALLEEMVAGEHHVALATQERHSRYDLEKIETRATPGGNGWRIDGVKAIVPNGAVADLLFVSALTTEGVSLFFVSRDTAGVTVVPFQTQDGHNAAEIRFENVFVDAAALVGEPGTALDIIDRAMDHGIAALCAEGVGSADYLIKTTTAYLKQREQYGAPLAKLQVLQHRLAEMYVSTELARSMATYAAQALSLPAAERKRALSAAKVQSIQSLRFVTQQAVQLHGGMGISEELDVAHHFKRAVTTAMLLGDEGFHLDRFQELDVASAV